MTVDLRVGLAAGHLVAAEDEGEVVDQAVLAQEFDCLAATGRGGDGSGNSERL